MKADAIKHDFVGKRSKAHAYIMPDGTVIENWPFSDRNVWATRTESAKTWTKGRMIHIELNYKDSPTDAQYDKLADLYVTACEQFGYLIIVPHKEVDRGVAGAHSDPENFDFDKLYQRIGTKGRSLDGIPKIDQVRYNVASQADQESNWPPVLSGPARRKPRVAPSTPSTKTSTSGASKTPTSATRTSTTGI
jgi:hypothetical protein